jgi:hypothetical protein
MLQLNDGPGGPMKIKSIRRATEAERRPAASACGSSSVDSPDKPPC